MSHTFSPNYFSLCSTYALLGMEDEMRAIREAFFPIMGGDKSRIIELPWLDEELAAAHEHLIQAAGLR